MNDQRYQADVSHEIDLYNVAQHGHFDEHTPFLNFSFEPKKHLTFDHLLAT